MIMGGGQIEALVAVMKPGIRTPDSGSDKELSRAHPHPGRVQAQSRTEHTDTAAREEIGGRETAEPVRATEASCMPSQSTKFCSSSIGRARGARTRENPEHMPFVHPRGHGLNIAFSHLHGR